MLLSFRIIEFTLDLSSLSVMKSRAKFFCELGKFTCGDGTCVSITARCDGVIDCPNDRVDEQDCRT